MSVPAKAAEQNGECANNGSDPPPETTEKPTQKTASVPPSNGSAQSGSVPVRSSHIGRYVYMLYDGK